MTNFSVLPEAPEEWYSEPVYFVNFIGNRDLSEDPSRNDGVLYLTEACEICSKRGC